jgi:MFS family permease
MTDDASEIATPEVDRYLLEAADVDKRVDGVYRLRRWITTPAGLLALLAVGYAITQLLIFDESRFLEWDEAVYVGKATDRFQSPPWSAHRALGVPYLLKPMFVVSASLVWMRWYLTLASAIALWLAFAAWLKTARYGAPIAMALFSTSWLAMFYGSEASPNLYVSACAVGAAGWLVRCLEQQRIRDLAPMAIGVSVAAVFRPSDGFMLGIGLALVGLLAASGWWRWTIAATALGAIGIGMIPWAIDAWRHFGDPIARWRTASDIVSGSLGWRLGDHLRLVNGPLIGPDRAPGIPILWLSLVLTGFLVAAAGLAFRRSRRITPFALGLSVFMASPYVLYVGALAPRFLLPTYGLLAVATGVGLLDLLRDRRLVGAVGVVVLSVFGLVSINKAASIEDRQRLQRSEAVAIAGTINELSVAERCTVLSQFGYPQLMIATDCRGTRLVIATAGCQVASLSASDTEVFVSLLGDVPPELAVAQIGEAASGPGSWVIARIDPARAVCEE